MVNVTCLYLRIANTVLAIISGYMLEPHFDVFRNFQTIWWPGFLCLCFVSRFYVMFFLLCQFKNKNVATWNSCFLFRPLIIFTGLHIVVCKSWTFCDIWCKKIQTRKCQNPGLVPFWLVQRKNYIFSINFNFVFSILPSEISLVSDVGGHVPSPGSVWTLFVIW